MSQAGYMGTGGNAVGSSLEDILGGGRSISVRIDEAVVTNISERVLESIRSDTSLCSAIRKSNPISSFFCLFSKYLNEIHQDKQTLSESK
jgi:hypothetical protein